MEGVLELMAWKGASFNGFENSFSAELFNMNVTKHDAGQCAGSIRDGF